MTTRMQSRANVLILSGVILGCNSSATTPTPTPTLQGDSGAEDQAAHGPYVYFYANPVDGGAIFGVPSGAATPVALVTGGNGHNYGEGFAFDNDSLYFSDAHSTADGGLGLTGTLLALPRAGGSPRVMADGLDTISAIALDSDTVYFVDQQLTGDTPHAFIGAVAKAGGPVAHFVDLPSGVVPLALAAVSGRVYWTQSDGRILLASASNGPPVPLSTGETTPFAIMVGTSGVYWLNAGHPGVDCTPRDGQIRALLGGQTQVTTLASNLEGASALAVNGDTVFWSTSGAYCNVGGPGLGSVFELASGGAAPNTLASGVTGPANLFVDAPTLHFTTIADPESDVLAPATVSF